MTSSITFELRTVIDKHTVEQQLSNIWKGEGYTVAILEYPEYGDELFCYLDYFFGYPEEEMMIRGAVAYLLDIAVEHQIYYYRYSEFHPLQIQGYSRIVLPVLEITVDDIFSEAFRPTIEISNEAKYLISGAKDSS
jgi:hypothetical protein